MLVSSGVRCSLPHFCHGLPLDSSTTTTTAQRFESTKSVRGLNYSPRTAHRGHDSKRDTKCTRRARSCRQVGGNGGSDRASQRALDPLLRAFALFQGANAGQWQRLWLARTAGGTQLVVRNLTSSVPLHTSHFTMTVQLSRERRRQGGVSYLTTGVTAGHSCRECAADCMPLRAGGTCLHKHMQAICKVRRGATSRRSAASNNDYGLPLDWQRQSPHRIPSMLIAPAARKSHGPETQHARNKPA